MLQDNRSNFNLLFDPILICSSCILNCISFSIKNFFYESLENIVFKFWIISPRFNVTPIQGSPTLGSKWIQTQNNRFEKIYVCVDAFAFLYFDALFICRNTCILQSVSYHPKWGTIWHRIKSQKSLSDFSNDVYYQDFYYFFKNNW